MRAVGRDDPVELLRAQCLDDQPLAAGGWAESRKRLARGTEPMTGALLVAEGGLDRVATPKANVIASATLAGLSMAGWAG
jgi:hypothetical protein